MEQLIVSLTAYRNKFIMENFLATDDILALVESGSFYMQTAAESFTVQAGEGALFRKDTLCHRRVITPVKLHLFRYESDRNLFPHDHILFADHERISSTMRLLGALDKDVMKGEFEKRRHLFADIVLQYEMENSISGCKDPVIEQALIFIKQNFHKSILLSRLGADSGLSYVQFLRRFKRYVGISPSEYIHLLRLQMAQNLLTDTTLSIKEIAYACGFENEYYFSNFFKKRTSLSPTAFRASLS